MCVLLRRFVVTVGRCEGEVRTDNEQVTYLLFGRPKTHLAYSSIVSANGVAFLQRPQRGPKQITLRRDERTKKALDKKSSNVMTYSEQMKLLHLYDRDRVEP